jgi:pilus assembly protein FimV
LIPQDTSMTSPSRRYFHPTRIRATHWAVALALGIGGALPAQAATVGHARVVSAPGAPLQIVVPLEDLTPEEQKSLRVSVAPASAWERAGVVPPVPVDSLRVRVQAGAQATRKTVRIESKQPISTPAVDVLLDVRSQTGSRQVQVTILVPQRASATPVQSARVGDARATRGATAVTTTVRAGDNLFRIARRYEVPEANIIQMLVAIWRANPKVFIQNNMNLLRAGERLTIPDAATIRAVDAREAQRIYLQHLEEFAHYRGRAGAQVAAAMAVGEGLNADAGQVTPAAPEARKVAPVAQDRLQLSASGTADAKQDAQTSEGHALQDTQQRVQTLQGNVQALSEAAGALAQRRGEASQAGQGAAGNAHGGGAALGAEASRTDAARQSKEGGQRDGAIGPGAAGAGSSALPQQGVAGAGPYESSGQGVAGAGASASSGQGAVGTGGSGSSGQGLAGVGSSASSGQDAAGTGSSASSGQGVPGAGSSGLLRPGAPGAASSSGGAPQGQGASAGSSSVPQPTQGAPAEGSGNGNTAATAPGASSTSASGSTAGGMAAGSEAGGAAGQTAGSPSGTDRSGAGNATGSTASAGVGATGSAGSSGADATPGAASSTFGLPGSTARPTTEAEAQDLAAAAGKTSTQNQTSTGYWVTDNLLAIVTAALALIVLIIAWAMRRAGARRADEHEEGADGDTVVDTASLTRKLEGIDLNLDTPPSDEPSRREPRR